MDTNTNYILKATKILLLLGVTVRILTWGIQETQSVLLSLFPQTPASFLSTMLSERCILKYYIQQDSDMC